jgi:hypothetical protein
MSIKYFLSASTLVLASSVTAPAFAHAKLQSSDPQAGSTLASAPRQIRLKFNEALEPAFSKIELTGPHDSGIPVAAAVDRSDATVMTAALPPLSAGAYRIRWSTMTHDGHKTKGEVTFTVR